MPILSVLSAAAGPDLGTLVVLNKVEASVVDRADSLGSSAFAPTRTGTKAGR